VLINGNAIRTRAIFQIQITASLSDKDVVHPIDSVIWGYHICKRVQSPSYCLWGPSTCTRRQKRWLFCFVPSGVGLHLFVGYLAIKSSLESAGCFCLCHLCNPRMQGDKSDTYNKHMR